MAIKRLSVQLANQIAAGEVVERPASVVKELLENAVDAKASSITLEIRNAGKTLVKVTDNGKGIPADELPLALAPHATSKIQTLEDLSAISTLGFRGEALASIASVSKLTLVSRTADVAHAYQVEVSGAEQHPIVEPALHNQGTSVIVRELFFNTPARRRFLKSDKTEFNHIKELITKIALVNCDIEFKFISDGKTILSVPSHGKEKMAQRIAMLLGSEFKHNLLSFDNTDEAFVRRYNHYLAYVASSGGAYHSFGSSNYDGCEELEQDSLNSKLLQMHGVLLRPPANRSLPDRLLTFLNGRCIADRTVNHAIREAFLNVIQGNSDIKPCVRGVIFMHCDPHIVDVNVHPRKDEVRFHNSNLIHDCIRNNIYAVLATAGLNEQNASQTSFELDDDFDAPQELSTISYPKPSTTGLELQNNTAASHVSSTAMGQISAAAIAQASSEAYLQATRVGQGTALPTATHRSYASSYQQQAASSKYASSYEQPSNHGAPSADVAKFAQAVDSYLERTVRPFASDALNTDEDKGISGRFAAFGKIRAGLGELEAITAAKKVATPFIDAFKAAKLKNKAEVAPEQIKDYAEVLATSSDTDDANTTAYQGTASMRAFGSAYGVRPNPLKVEPKIGKGTARDNEFKTDLNDLISQNGAEQSAAHEVSMHDLYALHDELNSASNHTSLAPHEIQNAAEPTQTGLANSTQASPVERTQASASEHENDGKQATADATSAALAKTLQQGDDSAVNGEQVSDSGKVISDSPYSDQSRAVHTLYGGSRDVVTAKEIYQRGEVANRIEHMTINKVSSMIDALDDGHKSQAQDPSGVHASALTLSQRKSNTKFLNLVAADVALIMTDQRYFMVRLSELYFNLLMDKYLTDVAKDQVRTQELNMPFSIKTDSILVKAFKQQDVLSAALRCGFSVKSSPARGCIDILAIPKFISGSNLALVAVNALQLISAGTDTILSEGHCPEQLAFNLSRCKSICINTEYDAKELTSRLSGSQQLLLRAKEDSVKELNLFSMAAQMLS